MSWASFIAGFFAGFCLFAALLWRMGTYSNKMWRYGMGHAGRCANAESKLDMLVELLQEDGLKYEYTEGTEDFVVRSHWKRSLDS